MTHARRTRRGHYALTLGATVGVLLAFGGLAVDVAWVLRARTEAQLVADAAARAAVVVLRRTGDPGLATDAATRVTALNRVAGAPPELLAITFGVWDDTATEPALDAGAPVPNAARVAVGRVGARSVVAWLARLAGTTSFAVQAQATAATRSVQVVVALDASPGWSEADFLDVADGLAALREQLSNAPAPADEVALSAYDSRYGWLITPPTSPATDAAALAASWSALGPASRAGTNASTVDGIDCVLHPVDDFLLPPGGCYPSMPRAYADETGVDPSASLHQLDALLRGSSSVAAHRVLIVVHGHPEEEVGPLAGAARTARELLGDVDDRFARAVVPVARPEAVIRADAVATVAALWADLAVHTFTVQLGPDDAFLHALVQGDGWAVATLDPTTLADDLLRVADALPVVVVR